MKEGAIFARWDGNEGMKGARKMLDIGKAIAVRDLAHRKPILLQKLAGEVNAHFDDGLLRGDVIDGFVKVAEALGTQKAK